VGRKVDVDELVGAAEIADRLGVHRQYVHQLRKRGSDFPEPVATLKQALVWAWPDVEAWCRRNNKPEGR
jgi:predicted DNA-binding transcriptional regulator AlpA